MIERARVLCVDDEEPVVSGLRRNLAEDFDVDIALGGSAALELVERAESGPPYAVIVTDMRMPGMNGAKLLEAVRERSPTTTRILLTGFSEIEAAIEVVNKGQLFRFLTKPCPPQDLLAAVNAGVKQHRLVTAEKELLEQTLNGCVQMLTELMALAQPGVPNSALAARKLASYLASYVGIRDAWHVELAAVVAQLTRVAMPEEMLKDLNPDANLGQTQREIIRQCLQMGHRLLSTIPRLERVRELLIGACEVDDDSPHSEPGMESKLLRLVLDYQLLWDTYGNSWGILKFLRTRGEHVWARDAGRSRTILRAPRGAAVASTATRITEAGHAAGARRHRHGRARGLGTQRHGAHAADPGATHALPRFRGGGPTVLGPPAKSPPFLKPLLGRMAPQGSNPGNIRSKVNLGRAAANRRSDLTVLLVEDNPGDVLLAMEYLREVETKFCVLHASSVHEACALLDSGTRVDVLLLDLHLPDSSTEGFDRLRSMASHLPIVLLTGVVDHDFALNVIGSFAQDYLPKSELGPHVLERALRYAVERQRLTNERDGILALHKRTLEFAGEGIVSTDQEGTITVANEAAERILGWPHGKLIGNSLGQILPHPTLGANGAQKNGVREGQLRQHDGKQLEAEWRISPIREGNTIVGNVLLFRDVSDRRRLERRLVQAEKMEAVGQLAAGVAHEINTPLQFIGDNTTFAITSVTRLLAAADAARALLGDPRVRELAPGTSEALDNALREAKLDYLLQELPVALQQTLDGVHRAVSIVQVLRNFAHPDNAEQESVDVREIIEDALVLSRGKWKDIADIYARYLHSEARIVCSRGELSQVIINLLLNSVHAIEEAQRSMDLERGRIEIETSCANGQLAIRMTDNGTGIPKDIQSRVFEPFFTTKEVGKGTGQGLALAHSVVVQRHLGSLELDSEVGKGTTLTIALPIA